MRTLRLFIAAAVWAVALRASAAERVSVAAAANLTYVLEPLNAAFMASDPGVSVTSAMGASGGLVAQINNGAPFDVFLSADLDFPRKLIAAGGAEGGAGGKPSFSLAHPRVRFDAARDAEAVQVAEGSSVAAAAAAPCARKGGGATATARAAAAVPLPPRGRVPARLGRPACDTTAAVAAAAAGEGEAEEDISDSDAQALLTWLPPSAAWPPAQPHAVVRRCLRVCAAGAAPRAPAVAAASAVAGRPPTGGPAAGVDVAASARPARAEAAAELARDVDSSHSSFESFMRQGTEAVAPGGVRCVVDAGNSSRRRQPVAHRPAACAC